MNLLKKKKALPVSFHLPHSFSDSPQAYILAAPPLTPEFQTQESALHSSSLPCPCSGHAVGPVGLSPHSSRSRDIPSAGSLLPQQPPCRCRDDAQPRSHVGPEQVAGRPRPRPVEGAGLEKATPPPRQPTFQEQSNGNPPNPLPHLGAPGALQLTGSVSLNTPFPTLYLTIHLGKYGRRTISSGHSEDTPKVVCIPQNCIQVLCACQFPSY